MLNLNLFSAPANLRYGHSPTNSKIQENFDPITCGSNWNNLNNCQHGMTNKERALLALVHPTMNWPFNLVVNNIPANGQYYCSNCPTRDPANGHWYLKK